MSQDVTRYSPVRSPVAAVWRQNGLTNIVCVRRGERQRCLLTPFYPEQKQLTFTFLHLLPPASLWFYSARLEGSSASQRPSKTPEVL